MRKEYSKALRDLFSARIQSDFPTWRQVMPPRTHYWNGERAFVRDDRPEVWLVVILVPNPKDHDAFHLEIGWSTRQRLPELSMRPCAEGPASAEALQREEYLCRLSEIVVNQLDAEGWVIDRRIVGMNADEILAALVERQTKISSEQARAVVSPYVDDAIAVFAQHGIPYLEGRLALLTAGVSPVPPNPNARTSGAG